MTFNGWERQLLGAMGLDVTPQRVAFLHAWARAEGGTARYNPLNTTMHVPGSTRYNAANVQNYRDALQGIAATILTLRLDFYTDVRSALAAHEIAAHEIAVRSRTGLDTWGTGGRAVAALLK